MYTAVHVINSATFGARIKPTISVCEKLQIFKAFVIAFEKCTEMYEFAVHIREGA